MKNNLKTSLNLKMALNDDIIEIAIILNHNVLSQKIKQELTTEIGSYINNNFKRYYFFFYYNFSFYLTQRKRYLFIKRLKQIFYSISHFTIRTIKITKKNLKVNLLQKIVISMITLDHNLIFYSFI